MKAKRVKYSILFSIAMITAAVLPISISSRVTQSSDQETETIPVFKSAATGPSVMLSPEFSSAADPVIIPLKRAGRLFLIEAMVDSEAGNLVFDTGANGLVVNSTYFRDYLRSGDINSKGITGDVGTLGQISLKKIEFSDLVFTNLTADMANLGHIENRRGVKILGLIGFSMLRDLEIVIDPVNSELMLFRIDKSGKRLNNRLPDFKPDYLQKITGSGNILFLKGIIGGKILNFCFDTGAETNAINNHSNRNILETLTVIRRTTLKGTGSTVSEVLFGKMNDFTIGDRQIRNMETIITNLDALSEAYGTHIDGMLGYNFLEQGTVCVNFVNNQVGIRFMKGEEK